MAPPTTQRLTANRLIAAFNKMDVPAILSLRAPTCTRLILPTSLSMPATDNTRYEQSLTQLVQIFHNFNLTVLEVIEDIQARKIVMHLSARADTAAGEYVNEYMWTLEFDESGERIVGQKEFVDVGVNRDFWPKLQAAIKERKGGAKESA